MASSLEVSDLSIVWERVSEEVFHSSQVDLEEVFDDRSREVGVANSIMGYLHEEPISFREYMIAEEAFVGGVRRR